PRRRAGPASRPRCRAWRADGSRSRSSGDARRHRVPGSTASAFPDLRPAPHRVAPFYWRSTIASSAAARASPVLTMLRTSMSARTVLIIDGDDTLWENNVHFEQAIEDFIDFLAHSALSREQVRATLDEIERLNSGVHGYGSAAFARNLRETYERLAERAIETRHLEHVMNLGRRIVQVELDLLPGVAPTLDYL